MAIRVFEFARLPDGDKLIRPSGLRSQSPGTVGASSAQSAAFVSDTRYVTVQTDEACYVVFGGNPTATTSGFKLAAGQDYDFAVEPGAKVAWIQA